MPRRKRHFPGATGLIAALLSSALLPGVAVAGPAAVPGPGPEADMVIENARVITMDEAGTIASTVAVKDGHIVAVGTPAQVARWLGKGTAHVNAQGRAILPGFIDAHAHVQGLAESEYVRIPIQAPPLKDGAAIIAALKARAAGLPQGAWLVGQGTYNQVMPTRAELDAAFPDNPVELRWSAHDSLINHKAAVLAGLTASAPDPRSPGRFERTPDGEVMIMRDAGVTLPVPRTTYDQAKAAIASTLVDFYLKRGVTTVYDMSDPSVAYKAYQELRGEGRLPVRMLLSYFIGPDDGTPEARKGGKAVDGMVQSGMLDSLLQSGLHTGMGDDWLRIGALKIPLDGVWGTTAATYRPAWKGSGTTYIPDNTGGVSRTQEVLNRQFILAQQNGWSVWVHANGDRAQDMVIAAVEAAQKAAPVTDARHRIEHFGHFLVQDPARTAERLRKMKALGIIPSPQVAMLWRLTDINVQEPDVGFFALHTLLDAGFQPPSGSDTLGTQNYATNPFFSIDRAVNRTTKFGTVVQPGEAITVEQALRMNTIWAARSAHLEASRGSVEVGKLADLVMLDRDPLATPAKELGQVHPVMTIVDGKIAWSEKR